MVIYSAGDQLDVDATYVAWILASAGARTVYLLDGGYAKWDLEGRPLTQRYPERPAPKARFRTKEFRPAVATLDQVRAAVAGSGTMLVDARPAEQYAGSAGAQLRRGHIPGAVNHPWKDDLEKPDLALVWKSLDALRTSYTTQGITPDKDIVVYCNSGTEASHVFFALKYLSWGIRGCGSMRDPGASGRSGRSCRWRGDGPTVRREVATATLIGPSAVRPSAEQTSGRPPRSASRFRAIADVFLFP